MAGALTRVWNDIAVARQPSLSLRAVFLLLLIGGFALATILRFAHWYPAALFGDDLFNYLAFRDGKFASSPVQALFEGYVAKYRPVFQLSMFIALSEFDKQLQYYWLLLAFIHGTSAAVLFCILYRVSNSILASLALAFAFCLSPFALYQLTQITGLVESLALLFFLLSIFSLVEAQLQSEKFWLSCGLAIFFESLAILSHERYIVVAPCLALALLALARANRLAYGPMILLAIAAWIAPLFYLSVKLLYLHDPFMVGTGGIPLGVDLTQIAKNLRYAISSLTGFNAGPTYLVGRPILMSDRLGKVALIGFFCATLLVAWGLYVAPASRSNFIAATRLSIILLLCTVIAILAPPIFTIRLEQRWLLAPLSLLLITLGWAVGRVDGSRRIIAIFLTLIVVLSSFILDSGLNRGFGDIFFVRAGRFAESVMRQKAKIPPSRGLAFLWDETTCKWSLAEGRFFEVYGGWTSQIICLGSPAASDQIAIIRQNYAVYAYDENQKLLHDVTDALKERMPSLDRQVVFNFAEQVSEGHLDRDAKLDTPNGRAAFVMPVSSSTGPAQSLVLIAGYKVRFDNILLPIDSRLEFDLGLVYPAYPPKVRIWIRDQQGEEELLYAGIPPARSADALSKFEPISLNLKSHGARKVSMTFEVEAENNKNYSQWVAFTLPRVTIEKASTLGDGSQNDVDHP